MIWNCKTYVFCYFLQYLYNQQQKSIVNTVPMMSGIMGILTYCLSKPGCSLSLTQITVGTVAMSKMQFPSLTAWLMIFPQGGGGGGGGGNLIFSYIRRFGPFFWVQNFEFWGFQKNTYFLGYENFLDIFWGHHKIELYLEVISMHFKAFFLKVKIQNWGKFFGLLKFQIYFWGA